MKRLIDNFVDKCMSLRTYDISLPIVIKQQILLGNELAKETKNISIEFGKYISDNDINNVVLDNGDEVFMQRDCETLKHEEVFEMFLDKYYGKELIFKLSNKE